MKNLFKTEGAITESNQDFTIAGLEKTFKEIEGKLVNSEITVFKQCIERGIIETTDIRFGLCSNENCKSCRGLQERIRKEFNHFKQL
jgi:hypothetical protein